MGTWSVLHFEENTLLAIVFKKNIQLKADLSFFIALPFYRSTAYKWNGICGDWPPMEFKPSGQVKIQKIKFLSKTTKNSVKQMYSDLKLLAVKF